MCSDLATVYTIGGSNPSRGKRFSLQRNVQAGSGDHIASCTMRTRRSFQGVRLRGPKAGHSPPASASPVRLPSVQRDNFSFFLFFNYDVAGKGRVLQTFRILCTLRYDLRKNENLTETVWHMTFIGRFLVRIAAGMLGFLAGFPSLSTLIPGTC